MEKLSMIESFDLLLSTYGPQVWWPGESQFEIIIGAILTQNTAWTNVARAIENLKRAKMMEPLAIMQENPDYVKSLIAPAGFFNVKYERLRNIIEYLLEYDMDFGKFSQMPVNKLRDELLEINGIGPETADSILLYAFNHPIFVVDAYTRRLFSRLGYKWMETAKYQDIQSCFMAELSPDTDLYNEFHALIVAHCKNRCRKKPLCSDCSLRLFCMLYNAEI
jgi:endonuclease-3 related protein